MAPILLKCIEHTGQLSGLWLTPDGMANGKPIKELWANRSISLISQNMCHIRLCLGRTYGRIRLQADGLFRSQCNQLMGNGATFSHRLRCTAIHLASLRAMGDAPESLEVAMEVRPHWLGVVSKLSGVAFCFDEPKTALHSSQSNQSGNQTVRWILHDVTFHPELCGRVSLKSIAQ